jgi:hypothetical protein
MAASRETYAAAVGLDLNLYMADFARLRALPAEEQVSALEDAIHPGEDWDRDAFDARGWVWPPQAPGSPPWCARRRRLPARGPPGSSCASMLASQNRTHV